MAARIEKVLSAHTVVKVITINVYGVAHMTLMFVKAVMNVFITLKKQVKQRNIINEFNQSISLISITDNDQKCQLRLQAEGLSTLNTLID